MSTDRWPGVVHRCPPGDSGVTPCCGRTPFELPRTDRMTDDPRLVTCRDPGASDSAGPDEALAEGASVSGARVTAPAGDRVTWFDRPDRPVSNGTVHVQPESPTHVLLGLPGCSGLPCRCPATADHYFEGCESCYRGPDLTCGECECHDD